MTEKPIPIISYDHFKAALPDVLKRATAIADLIDFIGNTNLIGTDKARLTQALNNLGVRGISIEQITLATKENPIILDLTKRPSALRSRDIGPDGVAILNKIFDDIFAIRSYEHITTLETLRPIFQDLVIEARTLGELKMLINLTALPTNILQPLTSRLNAIKKLTYSDIQNAISQIQESPLAKEAKLLIPNTPTKNIEYLNFLFGDIFTNGK